MLNNSAGRPGAAGVLALLVAAGCGRATELPKRDGQITPSYNKDTGRLERITYDRNRDGKVDAWTFMNGTRVARAEIDDTYDGRVDRWEYYDTGSGSSPRGSGDAQPAGVLTRVETATRDEGKPSRWEFYENGRRTRAEEDTDADGRVDKWETWTGAALAIVLLDTNGDGKADRRLVYEADGSGPRFEIDADGSGRFQPAR